MTLTSLTTPKRWQEFLAWYRGHGPRSKKKRIMKKYFKVYRSSTAGYRWLLEDHIPFELINKERLAKQSFYDKIIAESSWASAPIDVAFYTEVEQ